MGTSRRVVREVRSLPGNPARSEGPNRCVPISLRKPESFADPSQRICTFPRSKRAPIVEPDSPSHCDLLFRKTLPTAPQPAQVVLWLRKLSGFPTVSSAFLDLPTKPRLNIRQKSHSLPRARETIPLAAVCIRRDVDASAWPGCNL